MSARDVTTGTRSPGAAWQEPDQASAFLDEYRRLIPALDIQEGLISTLLTRGGRSIARFLDLGAGAGAFARLVLGAHPGSTGVLVDFSEPMIAAAEQRLAGMRDRWEYVRGDLSTPAWRDALPAGERYDAIVSGFCIHHLPDERKRALYEEVLELLQPSGIFLNWEHVAATGMAEGMFEEFMIERLVEVEQQSKSPTPPEEVARAYRERGAADDDILTDSVTQCGWLREAGFERVELFFQLPELALFGGARPGGIGRAGR
jgi:tRNA (cmo5U34)-methyltransferase